MHLSLMVKHVLIIQISMDDLFALLCFSKTPVLFEGTLSLSCMVQVKSFLFFLLFFFSSIGMYIFRRGPRASKNMGLVLHGRAYFKGFELLTQL